MCSIGASLDQISEVVSPIECKCACVSVYINVYLTTLCVVVHMHSGSSARAVSNVARVLKKNVCNHADGGFEVRGSDFGRSGDDEMRLLNEINRTILSGFEFNFDLTFDGRGDGGGESGFST